MFKKEVIREEGEPVLFKLNTILQIPLIQIPEDKTKVNITYQLIDPFVSVRIYWDENLNEVIYKIQEPELDENERTVLGLIEEGIKELINISLVNIKDQNVVIEYLEKSARILLTELRIRISVDSFIKIMYYIYRDFIGLNDLEPLMRDPFIEDIECNGIGTPIYIVHRKLRNLKTNLTFTSIPYLANLVEKIAQRCGKYVSYANPLLDGSLPDGSRANATYTQDISTKGPTITIRKFTKDPWTPTKLMKNKTVSPEMLAYLWLLLENESNIMVIGGTGSGKTSLLNSIAFFIPPPARIVSIEDTHELQLMHENWLPSVSREATSGFGGAARQGEVSLFDLLKESFRQRPDYVIVGEIRGSIRGNEEVVIVEDKITKRIQIKDLEGKDLTNILVPTLDKDLKISLKKLNHFIKHPPRNKLVEIITRTGRKVTVTEDHSLFTVKGLKVEPVETKHLMVGSRIIIPEVMPSGFNDIDSVLLTDYIKDLRVANVQLLIKKAISIIGQNKANKLCGCLARQYCRIKTKSNIPFSLFEKLMKEAKIPYNTKDLKVKSGNGRILNNQFELSDGFWRLIGYYLSEGHIANINRSLIISNSNKKVIDDVTKLSIELFGIKPKYRKTYGWGVCTQIMIHNSIVANLLINIGCGKTESKRVPPIIYGLSRNKICALLRGLYSGDGSFYKNEVDFVSKLEKLAEDVLYLLSCLGIVGRISFQKNKYRVRFKRIDDAAKFLNYVGFVQKFPNILQRGVTHTVGNSVNFSLNDLRSLRLTRKFRHLRRYMQCSKYYLKKIVDELNIHDEHIEKFVNGEFYIDEVKEIKQIYLTKPEPVYDLSISPTENFIGGFGGIVLHNSEAYVLFQGMASIKGNEKVMVLNSENPKDIPIENMKGNVNYKAFCVDIDKNNVSIMPVKSIIKHPNRSSLLNIKTKSGREVTITEDHSLFTYDNGAIPIRGDELKIGDTIIIPSKIPCGYADLDFINLIEFLPGIRVFAPSYVRKAVATLGYDNACKTIGLKAVSDYYANFTRSKQSSLTSDKFLRLMKKANISYNLEELSVKFLKKSKAYPPELKITKELLKLLGYYLSDGTINNSGKNSSIRLYNKNKRILKDMRHCIKTVVDDKIRERVTDRGFGSATELSFTHKVLFEFIKEYCGKGAKNKKIPDFIFGLNKDKIGYFLTGLYNGDGWLTRNQIGYSSISKGLIDGVTKLLLVYGIVGRISEYKQKNRENTNYRVLFYKTADMMEFIKYVGLIRKKVKLREAYRPDPYRKGDIYLDKIKDIKKIVLTKSEPVYDISVPGIRNFIGGFGGILLHNSGHSCMGTMHAEDVVTMIRRLETQPINLSPTLVDSLDAVCVMSQVKIKDEPARKLTAIVEILSVSEEKGKATTNTAFVWNPANDKFMFKTDLKVFDKIIQQKGITKDQLIKEFQTRVKLLIEMYKRNILEIADVHGIINEYYKNPQGVLKRLNIT